MKQFALALLMMAPVGWIATRATADESSKVVPGANRVTVTRDDGCRVVATVSVMAVQKGVRLHPDYWGTDRKPPRTIVSRILVTVGPDTVYIPRSAYGDLAEANEVTLTAAKNATLHVRGSDAGGAYDAYLEIVGKNLHKRTVRSREFPDERWEETVYSWIPDDDR